MRPSILIPSDIEPLREAHPYRDLHVLRRAIPEIYPLGGRDAIYAAPRRNGTA